MKPNANSRGVLYSRVSSRDQEQEGFSIPAQERLLHEYAAAKGISIAQEFVDVETAKATGRTGFNRMLDYVKKHGVRNILVEKTDRLYRNIKDWATLDELGINIHFVKEGVVIGPDSRSSDQLVHGIKVLMARNYSLNLGEETKKGQTQKALSGIYPSFAPMGYQNVEGPHGKRIITPNQNEAPVITELFNQFATGNYSLKTLVVQTRERGITVRGKKLQVSTLHCILRKKIYNGTFDYDGKTYQGTHEPLTTKETWDCVQRILDGRKEHQTKAIRREFPFSGLIQCGHCGCAYVAELKKKRYVYYHCTGHRGKCLEPYTRQETLAKELASTLGDLVIPPPILDWLAQELSSTEHTERDTRERTMKRQESERARIQHRLNTLYEDRLDGTITKTQYEEKASALRAQQADIERKLAETRESALVPLTTALDIACLTSNACKQFCEQNEVEQRRLLTMILKEATWKDGGLRTTLLEPFEQLRRSNQLSHTNKNGNPGSGMDLKVWLLG